MKFSRIVLQVNTHRLRGQNLTSHFRDGGRDVISPRKVLPPGEWTRSVCMAPMQHCIPVAEPLWSYRVGQKSKPDNFLQ